MHTVKQAVQLICPIRPATPRPSMCAADRCAMWRVTRYSRREVCAPTSETKLVPYDPTIREYNGECWHYEFTDVAPDGTRVDYLWQFANDTDDGPRGYCGLAGMPQEGVP